MQQSWNTSWLNEHVNRGMADSRLLTALPGEKLTQICLSLISYQVAQRHGQLQIPHSTLQNPACIRSHCSVQTCITFISMAFLPCESPTLLWDPDTIIPQPLTGPFATVGRRARDVVCRLLAPKSRRELRKEAMVPSTRQQPVNDLQKVSSGQLCISILCPVYGLDSSLNCLMKKVCFNWSKFTWYLESCTINLWCMKDKLVSSWYLSSDVYRLHWQQLLPNHGNDLWASNVAGASPRSYELNPPEVCSFRSHLQDVRTTVKEMT